MLGIYIEKTMVIFLIIFCISLFVTFKSLKRFSEAADNIEDYSGSFGRRLLEVIFMGLLSLSSFAALLVCIFQGRATIFWLS